MSLPRLGYKKIVTSIWVLSLKFPRERWLPCSEAALGRGPRSIELRPARSHLNELGSRYSEACQPPSEWAWTQILPHLSLEMTPVLANTLIATLWKMLSQNHLDRQLLDSLPMGAIKCLLFSFAKLWVICSAEIDNQYEWYDGILRRWWYNIRGCLSPFINCLSEAI